MGAGEMDREAGRLRAGLEGVEALAARGGLRVAEVVRSFGEWRGLALVLLLLNLPFVLPFPTMGLSLPIGLGVAALGLSLVTGSRPWLPAFVLRLPLERRAVGSVVRAGLRVADAARPVVRPRLGFMLGAGLRPLLGLSLVCSGLILALPIPLPLGNAVPAASILLLGAGLVEHDGLLVILGHVASIAAALLLALVWGAAWMAVRATLAAVF